MEGDKVVSEYVPGWDKVVKARLEPCPRCGNHAECKGMVGLAGGVDGVVGKCRSCGAGWRVASWIQGVWVVHGVYGWRDK